MRMQGISVVVPVFNEEGKRGYFYHCKGIINWEELLLLITEKRGWVLPLPIHAKLLPTV